MDDRLVFSYPYPMPHVHCGTTLGNGLLGLSVWGGDNRLNITVGVASLWDHRGGVHWSPRQNFRDIRRALERQDLEEIHRIFAPEKPYPAGTPRRPSLLAAGRLEVTLPDECVLEEAKLRADVGLIEISFRRGGDSGTLRIALAQKEKGLFLLQLSVPAEIRAVPSRDLNPELREISFPEPLRWACGFQQPMPADPGYSLTFERAGALVRCLFQRGDKETPPRIPAAGWEEVTAELARYWGEFWKRVPVIHCESPLIEELFRSGIFQFQSMTAPDGVPAGLQGAWIEDHRLPPWSGDYHFNINVQMCYWPAFRAGLAENCRPLFEMIWSWRDTMREIARCFIGVEDGYMMPHAVDDRCVCMGAFWTGAIDHACAAWMAQMMFDYYKFTGDLEFLREIGFEFMRGTMRVFEALLEERDGVFHLPVGVSPEYRGAELNAWGEDPSFQLAAIHRLAADLIEASGILGVEPKPVWLAIQERLPQFTLIDGPEGEQIALWKGTPLEESHRHHSHLAAIAPFATVAPEDPRWSEIIHRSVNHWVRTGMGAWAGWSMPWASMLHNRFGNAGMAVLDIELWSRIYRNAFNHSFHDPVVDGFAVGLCNDKTVMQMDAYMGVVAAIEELFLFERGGELHPMHGVPETWREFSAENLYAPGGFRLSLSRRAGREEIRVEALRGGCLKLRLPGGSRRWRCGEKACAAGTCLEQTMLPGETLLCRR